LVLDLAISAIILPFYSTFLRHLVFNPLVLYAATPCYAFAPQKHSFLPS
jgi:hypothetical protein